MADFPLDHVFVMDESGVYNTGVNQQTLQDAEVFLNKNGYVFGEIYKEHGPECVAAVGDIIREVVAVTPRRVPLRIVDPVTNVHIDHMDPANDQQLYNLLGNEKVPKVVREYLDGWWPPGKGFGAITSGDSLHNTFSCNVRADPKFEVFSEMAIGHPCFWWHLDRTYAKLPGCGPKEPPHVDSRLLGNAEMLQFAEDRRDRKEGYDVQCKFAVTEATFYVCPGSHTPEAAEEIVAEQPDLVNKNTLMRINPNSFPCRRLGMRGGVAVWFKNMVHQVLPRSANGPVQFGGWFGVQDAWPRNAWAKVAKIDEDVARLQSITTGAMMPRHPSGCPNPFHHMYRYPAHMESEVRKRPLGHKSVISRTKGDGQIGDDVIDTREVPYVMPAFSSKMKQQLGLTEYSAAEKARTNAYLASEVARWRARVSGAAGGARASGGAGGAAGGARASGGAGGAAGGSRAAEKAAAGAPGKRQAVASDTESDSDSDDGTAAGAPAAKRQAAWQCASCTLINDAGAHACEACLTMRQV